MTATTELKTAAIRLDIAAIAERYAAAWIAHDPAAILALHAPNRRSRPTAGPA